VKKKLNILILAVAVLAIAAAVSYAAIPSSNGTISACKDNKGALKVIDAEAGQTCGTNQQLLTWNQQGPAGQDGVSGYEIVVEESEPTTSFDSGKQILCPTGKKVLGGGGAVLYATGGPSAHPNVNVDAPLLGGIGWDFRATWLFASTAWKVRAYAICAAVQ
jgi:hypothetical protein